MIVHTPTPAPPAAADSSAPVPTPTPAAHVAAAAASSPGRTVRHRRSTFPAVRRRMPAPPPALPTGRPCIGPALPGRWRRDDFFFNFLSNLPFSLQI